LKNQSNSLARKCNPLNSSEHGQTLRGGSTIKKIFRRTKIKHWFLTQLNEVVGFEERLAGAKN